jgi:hypothetical protein
MCKIVMPSNGAGSHLDRCFRSLSINFTLHTETFFSSHLLDSSTGPLGTAHVQLEKGGRIRNIHGFRVNYKGSNNKKAKELRQLKKSHEDK